MKRVVYILILTALTLAAYKLGYHNGTQIGNTTAASYQELYNQAIQNQMIDCNNLPKITPNIKLKEKNK